LLPRWDTEAAAQALTGCTVASLVPTQLHRLVGRRRPFPPSVRLLLTGGGPLDPALAEAARALGCAPTQTYGLTETASMATCETVPSGLTAGSPVVGELRLAADGGIEVRGPHLFDGYEDEEGGLRPPCDAEGWYATGDAGRLDDEGRLIVLGRRTDLIVSGGENLYPAEIELLLERHPAIQEARVRGEADDEWGQVPVADVVAPGLTADQWFEALAEVPSYKRPRRYRLVAALPRTSTGKLQRG
jgi:O-succinylbenzoic acid--CoA ligase